MAESRAAQNEAPRLWGVVVMELRNIADHGTGADVERAAYAIRMAVREEVRALIVETTQHVVRLELEVQRLEAARQPTRGLFQQRERTTEPELEATRLRMVRLLEHAERVGFVAVTVDVGDLSTLLRAVS